MSDPYAELRNHFAEHDLIVVNSGRGAQGMKIGTKMFAMFYKGDLVLSFPPLRVQELIESGEGLPFDPGTGKPMKNRVLIPATKIESWISLSEESALTM
ncbi:hypothetical protein KQI63_01000 [bacterium]|nr:hypothetical protein [bacterium]